MRISAPKSLFDAQFTYDLQPLLYEQITAESGATIAHDSTNRVAVMTFTNTPTGGKAFMQTFEHFRYQPGKSQIVLTTFNFQSQVANVLKFAGYSDGVNGIEFQNTGATNQFIIYSATLRGNQTAIQANWNLDKLDGTGPSGVTLDLSKSQILVIDFQALYVGRVRCGFDIGGEIIYAHEFTNANDTPYPYWQTANLPVRVGMTCTGTVSTTMHFVCSAAISETGVDDTHGFTFTTEGTVTAANGVDTHILSIQPRTTFNGIVNRTKIVLEALELLVTGANPIKWKLGVGQALTGTTPNDINTTYSAMEEVTGALSGAPAIIISQGHNPTTGAANQVVTTKEFAGRYPITLDAAGAVRDLGRLTLLVQGIGGVSATRAILRWREIR
jgi:hypothetical protein